jgi:hypothetical protein
MATTQYLNYYIHLTDQEQVAAYQAQFPGGVIRAPGGTGAQIEFAAPLQLDTQPFVAPCIRSPYFTGGANYPVDVATFTRKSGGWFGIPLLFGQTTRFYWVGRFVYTELAEELSPETIPAPLSKRRWIDGFELPPSSSGASGEGGTGALGSRASREASRTVDGFGCSHRHHVVQKLHSVMQYRGGGASTFDHSWERFYVRVRRFQTTGEMDLWFAEWADSASGSPSTYGIQMRLAQSGQLVVYNRRFGGVMTQIGVSSVSLVVDQWVKIDCLFGWVDRATGADSTLRLYVNGTLAGTFTGESWFQDETWSAVHAQSVLGTLVANNAAIDFDDWMSSDVPVTAGGLGNRAIDLALLTTQPDWRSGSHMVLVRASAFSADHSGNWVGDLRTLLQNPMDSNAAQALTSSSSGARLAVGTDAEESIDGREGSIGGCQAIVVGLCSLRAGAADGQLGYSVAGAAEVLATVVQSGTMGWTSVLFAPSALAEPPDVTPLKLIHTKGASVDASQVRVLAAVAELLGTFGDEDREPGDAVVTPYATGLHNAPYPRTPWALLGQAPPAPVTLIGGTYVGNGTGQDITFPLPPAFLFVRPITGTVIGWHWWSSMLAPHQGLAEWLDAKMMPNIEIDPTFPPAVAEDAQEIRARMRITGSDQQNNANTVVYQYIAVCDPGGRFMINGAFAHDNAVTSAANQLASQLPQWAAGTTYLPGQRVRVAGVPYVALRETIGDAPATSPLDWKAGTPFTPECAHLQVEGYPGAATSRRWFKGIGHTGAQASELTAVAPVALCSFSAGQLTSEGTSIHLDPDQQVAYSAWRRNDGSADVGVNRVIGLVTWVGDGVNPRVITVTPAVDRRPLYVLVKPANAAAVYRDPSNTGTTSLNIGGSSIAANGISAGGLGTFSVGSQLNAAGIIYDACVIWGGETAGNGGWSQNGEFWPVEPAALPGMFPIDLPLESPEIGEDDPGSGGGTPPEHGDIDDDLADAACVTPTTRIVNLALQRIGVSNKVMTLASELTLEADAIRTAYDETLQETLRAHPWPFATRYRTLTLLAGSSTLAASTEWQYSYQVPDDCVFPRRLVTSRSRAVDPTPPPFREAGGVIFSNQAAAVLEYTSRVHCPAIAGDATFRSAWAWRLAAELAPVLTRMPDRQAHCLEMWQGTISLAMRFLRLGAPGLRAVADPADPDLNSLATKLQVINLALTRIGAKTIADLTTEQSREAVAALLLYEDELRATIRDFHWPFATRYGTDLTLVSGPAWEGVAVPVWSGTVTYGVGDVVSSGGTTYYAILGGLNQLPPNATYWSTDVPGSANADWVYGYRVPTGSIGIRRLVNVALGRLHDPAPPRYRLGSDGVGLVLYTSERDVIVEYAIRPKDALSIADPGFKDAYSWRLAAALAMSVPMPDPEKEEQTGQAPKNEHREPRRSEGGQLQLHRLRMEKARWAWSMYERMLSVAKAQTANEMQPEDHGDAPWITGRD